MVTRPNVQLSISTSEQDHIAELLEATKKMTRYSKSHINTTKHIIIVLTVTTPVQTTTMQVIQTNTNANLTTLMIKLMKFLVKHVHLKAQNQNLKTLKTPITLTVWIASLTLHQTPNDYHELTKLLRLS